MRGRSAVGKSFLRHSLTKLPIITVLVCSLAARVEAQQQVSVHFAAFVGDTKLACGRSYEGIGTTQSRITPQDIRFYVHNVRLVDKDGAEVPIELNNDGKWQVDDIALLDFEDATGSCVNGTPDTNDSVNGVVASGRTYTKLRFTLGVPLERNHLDPLQQPSPLNLSALMWVWNAGHKFTRLDFISTGQPRGYPVHLGSTGCTPSTTKTTIPTSCSQPNRVEVEIDDFDVERNVVVADLAQLLSDTNVDEAKSGCMSDPADPDCQHILPAFGLPFGEKPAPVQRFFRKGRYESSVDGAEKKRNQ